MEIKEGQRVLAWDRGEWRNGTYIRKGDKPGEHLVTITPDNDSQQPYTATVIKNEIQTFLD